MQDFVLRLATAVAVHLERVNPKKYQGASINPDVIQMIIQIIMQLLPVIIGCFATKPAEAAAAVRDLGPFRRAMLHWIVWRNMPSETWRIMGDDICSGIVEAARTVTDDEMTVASKELAV